MTTELKAKLNEYEDVHVVRRRHAGLRPRPSGLAPTPASSVLQYLAERKQEYETRQDARYRKGSSQYRGVSWDTAKSAWQMCAILNGGKRLFKRFSSEAEAARCYDHVQIQRFGR